MKEPYALERPVAKHAKPFVSRTPTTLSLHFSIDQVQSRMDVRDPTALDLEYSRTMMGFLIFEPDPANIAMIGLGGGSLAKFCYRHLPKCRIQVVEINPHVIALREKFRVPQDNARFNIIEDDGAEFLRLTSERFSVLLVDGYDSEGFAESLSSQDFYDSCFEKLAEGGQLVINLHADLLNHVQQVERIRRSFKGEALTINDRLRGNLVVFARRGAKFDTLRLGQEHQPAYFDAAAWKSLHRARTRILKTLKKNFG